MKNNIKLFFKSLINNNSAIDGGRNKPWYAAILMFFFSIVIALVPTFVSTIKVNGDDVFGTYSYGFTEASVKFNEALNENGVELIVQANPVEGEVNQLVSNKGDYTFMFKDGIDDSNPTGLDAIQFEYFSGDMNSKYTVMEEEKYSHVVLGATDVYVRVVNQYSGEVIATIYCKNAYKKFAEGYSINSFLEVKETSKETAGSTFENWKSFYREAYHDTKYINLGRQCLVAAIIDVVLVVLMGFMVWILTRGKQNVYRPIFNLWNSQKVAYWASITPALLTCALGFLFTNFMVALFPLLLGVRVMWLSMKSLRPDGSGYAAN